MAEHKNTSNEQMRILDTEEHGEFTGISIQVADNGFSLDIDYHKKGGGMDVPNYHTDKKVYTDTDSLLADIKKILEEASKKDDD